MTGRTPAAAAALTALLLGACATAPVPPPGAPPATRESAPPGREVARPPAAGKAPFEATAARFTGLAVRQERAGDLRGALASWRIVAALQPGNAEPKRRTADLEGRVKKAADRHFKQGLARLQEGAAEAARKEFLLTLLADPDHTEALFALKNRVDPVDAPYIVAAGDTLEGIARKFYDDPAKALLVARVNDLDPKARPVAGTVLSLPLLGKVTPAGKAAPKAGEAAAMEPRDAGEVDEQGPAAELPGEPVPPSPPTPAPDPTEQQLARAVEFSGAQRYPEAIAIAAKITGHPALGARARQIVSDAWFGLGERALQEDRFTDAAEAYRKVDPALKDVPAALAALERRKKERAEEFYNEGVRFFINQKLDEAIGNWERTLALNPQHPQAAKDLEKARTLRQKLHEMK